MAAGTVDIIVAATGNIGASSSLGVGTSWVW